MLNYWCKIHITLQDLKPGSLPAEPLRQDDFNLGDIILGLPHIVDQLYDTPLQQHLPVCHSILGLYILVY